MKKNEPSISYRAYSREIIYATLNVGQDSEQSLYYVGGNAEKVLGYNPGHLSGEENAWISSVHPDDRKKVAGNWRKVYESKKPRTIEYRMKAAVDSRYLWIEDRTAPRFDAGDKVVGVVGSVVDISSSKGRSGKKSRAETVKEAPHSTASNEKTARLNRILRMLSNVNRLILREENRDSLFQEVCNAIVDGGEYRLAWIGLVGDGGRRVTPVTWSDGGEELLKGKEIPLGPGKAGEVLLQAAVDSKEASICNDLTDGSAGEGWCLKYLERGYLSAGFFPMHIRGSVEGVVGICSDEKKSFGREESLLLSELADDIGCALWAIGSRTEQAAATEAILDREFWLNESQRVAHIGSYVYDFGKRKWSGTMELGDLLGLGGVSDREPDSLLNIIHPDDREWLNAKVRNLSGPNNRLEEAFRVVRASDKQVRWVWATAEIRTDASGKPAKLFGTMQDITGRKQTEDALAQSENLFHTSFENSSIGIALLALYGRYQWVNAKFSQMMGYAKEELMNLSCKDLTFPDDAAATHDVLSDAFAWKTVGVLEKRYVRKDGQIIWVEFSVSLVRNFNDEPGYLIANFNDITERKRAEEDFRNEHILLMTLIDNLPNSIYVKDTQCRKTLANPANVQHAGKKSESEVLGRTDFELYPFELAQKYSEDDQTVLRDGKAILITEEYGFTGSGEKKWQLTSKIPLRDKNGKIVGLIGIGTDITERKHLEEAREEERRLLRTLIDNLPSSVFVKDTDYRKTVANKEHLRHISAQLGAEKQLEEFQVLGKTDFELLPKELAERHFQEDQKVIRNGEAILEQEELEFDSEGKRHWSLVSKIPLRDSNGNISGLLGIKTDITARKLAEEAMSRERLLLRTIIDRLPASVWVKDKAYRKTLVNRAHIGRMSLFAVKKITSEFDLLGKTDSGLYPPDKAKIYNLEDREVIVNGKSVIDREELVVDIDGNRHWQLVSKVPLLDEYGLTTGLVGIVTDITKQKEAEEESARGMELLRTLIDNLPNAVFVKDRKLCKVIANPSHVKRISLLTGGKIATESDIIGKTDIEILSPTVARSLMDEDQRVINEGVAILNRENHSIDPDGEERWELVSKIPLRDKAGEITGLVGITTEITEQKRVQKELRTSEETLARITGSISDIIYSVNGRTGEFEYLSPAFEKALGYSSSDIKAMGGRWAFLLAVIEGADPTAADPVMEEMQYENAEYQATWENWWKCKDGARRFIEDESVPVYEEGRLVRIDGVLRDFTVRKLAEEEIEKERVLLRTLIDNIPHAIYVKDRNYRKVIANPVDVRLFAGLSSEAEIVGMTDFDVYPRETAEKYFEDDRRVIENGESIVAKQEFLPDVDGKEHWILTTKVPLRGNDGAVNGLVGIGLDVTEIRTVDEALKRSEAELRAIFESMHDVVMAIDSEGRYVKVAPTDPSLLYKPAAEIVGKTLFDVLPGDQANQFFNVIKETLLTSKIHTLEYRMVVKGQERWRSATVSPMNESTVLWVARDVSERKKMEKEITDSEKKYRELVENALVGVYKINLSGTIVYINKAMADMLEYDSPQELMSVSFSSLYNDLEDSAGLIDELRKFGKTDQNREIELKTKTGKVRNVLINASLEKDVISGMAKDITEIRTLERQFIQTQKLEGLGNIAAGIAHDFNNILGVILGYSDLLGQSEYSRERFQRGMEAIAKSADRGKSLVRQLLTFARKTEVEFESVDLNNSVAEMEKLMRETFPKTVEVRTKLATDLPPVFADATQIHQVILNICLNARDAMPKGGILSISTDVVSGSTLSQFHHEAASDKYIELRIADNGTGMDEAIRQKIFEPFFTTKGVGKGTGLGLSVVYGIVESHRGFIDVQTEPGNGTAFRIYFPVLKHETVDAAHQDDASGSDRGKRGNILVIEDEEMLRELLRSILTARGHNVIFANDGEEGLSTFVEQKDGIDIVLTDLGLPKLGGEEVVRRIRDVSRTAKVVVASGFIAPEVRDELEEMGVNYFIQKPYRTAEVLKVVDAILSTK